ncbi:EAL domain-containing protein [Levilactobacillus namurensis]|uniref:EAL domain-containing protein n=1 Tax=Levilactobacillus namurensis TaxID=380393 RepID=UPI0026EF1D1E|nr:EAL domain-containing protein [Levilactobacillus namurensis]
MPTYRFFVQPQIDQDAQRVIGYEALLRQQVNRNWVLPASFTAISVTDQIKLLAETATVLNVAASQQTLAFNLNNAQFHDPRTLGAIVLFKKQFTNVDLTIELTEAPQLDELTRFSTVLHQYGIQLIIDDVGTGSNTYANIRNLLPFVDEIKFAMQNLRATHRDQRIPYELAFWSQIARTFRLRMILEGIENAADQALAKRFGISIHQGYLYGKPSLPA